MLFICYDAYFYYCFLFILVYKDTFGFKCTYHAYVDFHVILQNKTILYVGCTYFILLILLPHTFNVT